jgi:hypothetical protein
MGGLNHRHELAAPGAFAFLWVITEPLVVPAIGLGALDGYVVGWRGCDDEPYRTVLWLAVCGCGCGCGCCPVGRDMR